jgi:hypothetical protein
MISSLRMKVLSSGALMVMPRPPHSLVAPRQFCGAIGLELSKLLIVVC